MHPPHLVIQLKRLGDLLLSFPAIRNLEKSASPLVLVSNESQAAIPLYCGANNQTCTTKFIVYQKRDFRRWNIKVFRQIFAEKFEHSFDCSGTQRSALLTAISHAKNRCIWRTALKNRSAKLLGKLIYNQQKNCSLKELHTIDFYHCLLRTELRTGIHQKHSHNSPEKIYRPQAPPNCLKIPPKFQNLDSDTLKIIENKNFYLIHPGAARKEKMWSVKNWLHCAEIMREFLPKAHCVISGAANAKETKLCAEITANLQAKKIPTLNLNGKTNFPELARLVSLSRLLISVDTSAMHIASLIAAPQIALFGPTNPYHWRPLHQKAAVIHPSSPLPMQNFQPKEKKAAISQITPKQLQLAAQELRNKSVI